VIHIDGFGNTVTNITYETLKLIGVDSKALFKLIVDDKEHIIPYVRRFSAVEKGELLLLVAGGGYLEISVNQGNARELLGMSEGTKIRLQTS
jgi:S-adenosylmethionine hydrolase